jgi:hypothetical protein
VKHLTSQHAPDFLLTWRPVLVARDVFTPDLGAAHTGRDALPEAEALQRWLVADGDLDVASRYGLAIIVGDDALDRCSKEQSGEEANHG